MRRDALVIIVASLWMAAFGQAPGRAEVITPTVVFGNLGTQGNGSLDETSTLTGTTTSGTSTNFRLAQGFTTGTTVATSAIQSVTLGIAAPVGQAGLRTVQIWSNAGGNLPGSLLFTSAAVSVDAVGRYTFPFAAPWLQLEASTTYWIVPSNPVLWYLTGSTLPPEPLNGSDWAWVATRRQSESTQVWSNTGTTGYAVSVVAVPEQGALPVACIGLVGVAWACRGRMRRSDGGSVPPQ